MPSQMQTAVRGESGYGATLKFGSRREPDRPV